MEIGKKKRKRKKTEETSGERRSREHGTKVGPVP